MFVLVVTSTTLQSHCQYSFTQPRSRLVHDYLESLSCQRLGPHTTLTTWISLLYVRLTDYLEFQDATLLESLSNYIHHNTSMKSLQETHRITSSSCHIHVPTPKPHVISKYHNLIPFIWNTVLNITRYMLNIIYHTFKE